MANRQVPGKKAGCIVLGFTAVALIFWIVLAFVPMLSLRSGFFTLNTEKEVELFPKILQQLGTFGDMYGVLNCFFSGAAFIGVIYTIILQHRQIYMQEQDSKQSERAAVLQNRFTAYQNLTDHHRYERDRAGKDRLLEARSKGRVRAFAELMANLLGDSEAYIKGEKATEPQEQNFHDHPARIRHLAYQYHQDKDSVSDCDAPFGPVESLLLELVEEIAALTELAKKNADVQAHLLAAGHAVNAAVQPHDLVAPELAAKLIRIFQVAQAEIAFKDALRAAELLLPTSTVNPVAVAP